mmetsp:Transcript_13036/g.50951  ORF Transcript_13036/g.50951 Transcript_13036/m.50951 type:complete len:226 (-) Transcript_13036:129-806(-)
MLIGTLTVSKFSPARKAARTSGDIKFGSVGLLMKGSSLTTSIKGSRSTNERTVVDFPVPRSPITIIPPMFGSMMFMIAANFISSWPIMALKGYTGRAAVSSFVSLSAAWARAFEIMVRLSSVFGLLRILIQTFRQLSVKHGLFRRRNNTCSRRKSLQHLMHSKELRNVKMSVSFSRATFDDEHRVVRAIRAQLGIGSLSSGGKLPYSLRSCTRRVLTCQKRCERH